VIQSFNLVNYGAINKCAILTNKSQRCACLDWFLKQILRLYVLGDTYCCKRIIKYQGVFLLVNFWHLVQWEKMCWDSLERIIQNQTRLIIYIHQEIAYILFRTFKLPNSSKILQWNWFSLSKCMIKINSGKNVGPFNNLCRPVIQCASLKNQFRPISCYTSGKYLHLGIPGVSFFLLSCEVCERSQKRPARNKS